MNYDMDNEIYETDSNADLWSVDSEDDSYIVTETTTTDLNSDGVDDIIVTEYDINNDGYVDAESAFLDPNSDGNIDYASYSEDFNYDGTDDIEIVAVDSDSDGNIDYASYSEDFNYDGNVDLFVTEADTNYDTIVDYTDVSHITYNEDGSSTVFHASATDTDFDGQFDDFDYGIEEISADENLFIYDEPAEEAPVIYDEPAEEAPVIYDEPAEEAPVIYDEPAEEDFSPFEILRSEDLNADGEADSIVAKMDLDGDGEAEGFIYAKDLNFDGKADIIYTRLDSDGDGDYDVTNMKFISHKEDGSSKEFFITAQDLDNDGRIDDTDFGTQEISAEENESFNIFDVLNGAGESAPETEGEEIPSPSTDAESEHINDDDNNGFMDAEMDLDSDSKTDDVNYDSQEDSAEENETFDQADIDSPDDEDDESFTTFDNDESSEEITDDVLDYSNENTDYESNFDENNEVDYEEYEATDSEEYEGESVILPIIDYNTTDNNGTYCENLDNFDPNYADEEGVIGNPEDSIDYWEYQYNTNRCAIYAQKFAIEEYTNQEVDIEELVDTAVANGWFTEDGGTPVCYMDKLLQYYGVPCESSYHNTIEDLSESLNEGHRIIVDVDSDEYWYGENDGIYTPNDGTNHAIEVIGIDVSDADNPVVIVNDSGTYNGQGLEIPMETFMDAWEDGNCHMIEC